MRVFRHNLRRVYSCMSRHPSYFLSFCLMYMMYIFMRNKDKQVTCMWNRSQVTTSKMRVSKRPSSGAKADSSSAISWAAEASMAPSCRRQQNSGVEDTGELAKCFTSCAKKIKRCKKKSTQRDLLDFKHMFLLFMKLQVGFQHVKCVDPWLHYKHKAGNMT